MKKFLILSLLAISIFFTNSFKVSALNTITADDWTVENLFGSYWAIVYRGYTPADTSSISIKIPDTQYITLDYGQESSIALGTYDGSTIDYLYTASLSEIFNIDDDADLRPDTIYIDIPLKWVHTSTNNYVFTEDITGFNYIVITLMITVTSLPSGYMSTYFIPNAPISFVSDTAVQVVFYYMNSYGRFSVYDNQLVYDGLQIPEVTEPSFLEGYTFAGWKTITGDLYDISSPFSEDKAISKNWLDNQGRLNLYASYFYTEPQTLPTEGGETPDFVTTILTAFGFGSTEGKAIIYAFVLIAVTIISLVIVNRKGLPNFLIYAVIIVWNILAIAINLIPFFVAILMGLTSVIVIVIMLKIKDRNGGAVNEFYE